MLAFVLAVYALVASIVGIRRQKERLQYSAYRAVVAIGVLVTISTGILLYSLLTNDFRLAAVAGHSNRALPWYYKLTALWSGQEGSLLFWSWLLSCYGMVAVLLNREKHRSMMPYAVAVLMVVQGFFLVLNNFIANPFQLLALNQGGQMLVQGPLDGSGLNPLLQYPAMAVHPPLLYLGFVGFTVPFAFAMATLITRQAGDKWIETTRRWTMVAWLFLSMGVMMGARWAYAVLGWGGYWGWDPVENASLIPWFTGTAFLHSVMMQEKRGMMKVWNMVLIFSTFFLTIFGTFMTRSGVVSSVHAFAESDIGMYFVVFLGGGILFSGWLLLERLDYLKSASQLDSLVSRESSFLFNNLLLLAACFSVLWGTLFPVITEAVQGVKISVGAPFFNKVNTPIALVLLFLTGVGPLFAWRKTSVASLRKNFQTAGIISLAFGGVLFALGVRQFYPPGFVDPVRLCHDHHRDGVLPGIARHCGEVGPLARRLGRHAHAAQHAALRRLYHPLRDRAHLCRDHRLGVQRGWRTGDADGRPHAARSVLAPPARIDRRGQCELRGAARHPRCLPGRTDDRHVAARAAFLQGEPPAHHGSRHPHADE